MRVVGGLYRSRKLTGPPPGVRPTSDKLRETLFNILGPTVEGAVFLDGCAGTGGIGIEAISRGAAMVVFIEQARASCEAITTNLKSLGVTEGYRLKKMDLSKALEACARDDVSFDVAFVDPPYEREELYAATLERFGTLPILKVDGMLVIEHSNRMELPGTAGRLRQFRSRAQGDSVLSFYRPENA